MMKKTGKKDGGSGASSEIDANLRRVYEQVLKEEVPDRFSDLLDRLRRGEQLDGAADTEGSEV